MGAHQIDDLDRKILSLITKNARVPFLEVARECSVSGAAIHQRIQRLANLGVIKGSEFIVEPSKIGYHTCAYIGVFLKQADMFEQVSEELQRIPEVVECYYTTGKYAMFVKIYSGNNKDLLKLLHKLQGVEGISSTETIICLDETFKRQLPICPMEK